MARRSVLLMGAALRGGPWSWRARHEQQSDPDKPPGEFDSIFRHGIGFWSAPTRVSTHPRVRAELARPSEYDIDAGKNGRESGARNLSNAPLEDLSIEGDDLRNVGNGGLGEAGIARRESERTKRISFGARSPITSPSNI